MISTGGARDRITAALDHMATQDDLVSVGRLLRVIGQAVRGLCTTTPRPDFDRLLAASDGIDSIGAALDLGDGP